MQGDNEYGSSLAPHHPRLRHTAATLPYSSSLGACASVSLSSVCSNGSDTSSQSSQSSVDDATSDCSSAASSQTSISSVCLSQSSQSSQSGSEVKIAAAQAWRRQQQQQQQSQPKCTNLRQNPRRSSVAPAVVPSLVRQSDRRTTFVDHLVDASTQIVQAIWPLSSVVGRADSGNANGSNNGSYLLPLRTFIQETLRRSRASYSTLQVALYYLVLIQPHLPSHNFTMEQSSDSHACRALQCGRRMFLAALILASKYLQDRNYSARAWSKISGLSTAEINQNESAFLHAVNWRLHITNEVYSRWIECVTKFNSPQLPPSPGPAVADGFDRRCTEFRALIKKLSPSLDNLDELCGAAPARAGLRRSSFQIVDGALSPVSMCSSPESAGTDSPLSSQDSTAVAYAVSAAKPSGLAPMPMAGVLPGAMEHSPVMLTTYTPSRVAPALGHLPTPRLAPPQAGIFNCAPPTASVACGASTAQMLAGSRSSMCFAVAQASNAASTQILDRWPSSLSPSGCVLTRRSSLANSVSTASSPESMVSDSSFVSRSSSASLSWSQMNAPSAQLSKLDCALARHRFGIKSQCSGSNLRDKSFLGMRSTVLPALVPEDYETGIGNGHEPAVFASPETTAYTGPVGKDLAIPGRRTSEADATVAALTLAEMQQQQQQQQQHQQHHREYLMAATGHDGKPRTGIKRSRPMAFETSLMQDNVRELLRGSWSSKTNYSLEAMAMGENHTLQSQQQPMTVAPSDLDAQVAARAAALTGSRKRLCRTTSAGGTLPTALAAPAARAYSYGMDLQHPSMNGMCGPGMWQGVLN